MSVETELNRIIKSLEVLNEAVTAQRKVTSQQCAVIQNLFKPWSSSRQSEPSSSLAPNTQSHKDRSPDPEQTLEELCPELEKIEQLLTKVQKVRRTVNDEEVMNVCQIKAEEINVPIRKPVKPEKTADRTSPSNEKAVTARPMTSGKGRRVLQAMNGYQTTYQTSYKTKNLTKSKSYQSNNGKSKPAESKNSHHVTGRKETLTAAAKCSIPSMAAGATSTSADTPTCNSKDPPGFSLLTHGKELNIPKSMRHVISRHKSLRLAADSLTDSPIKHAMPNKLVSYFASLQAGPLEKMD